VTSQQGVVLLLLLALRSPASAGTCATGSYRDVEESSRDRLSGCSASPHCSGHAARLDRHSPGARWFVDETYVRVNAVWRYVHRGVERICWRSGCGPAAAAGAAGAWAGWVAVVPAYHRPEGGAALIRRPGRDRGGEVGGQGRRRTTEAIVADPSAQATPPPSPTRRRRRPDVYRCRSPWTSKARPDIRSLRQPGSRPGKLIRSRSASSPRTEL
jgi:hypothetical protein